jgi:hypothetical protein
VVVHFASWSISPPPTLSKRDQLQAPTYTSETFKTVEEQYKTYPPSVSWLSRCHCGAILDPLSQKLKGKYIFDHTHSNITLPDAGGDRFVALKNSPSSIGPPAPKRQKNSKSSPTHLAQVQKSAGIRNRCPLVTPPPPQTGPLIQ